MLSLPESPRQRPPSCRGTTARRAVMAQVEIESKNPKRFIIIQFQAPELRRLQHGFDRVNLHHPTVAPVDGQELNEEPSHHVLGAYTRSR